MTVSRRNFVSALGLGSAGLLASPSFAARGREADLPRWLRAEAGSASPMIRLDSNENPNGPGMKAFEAMRGMFGEANRYPDAEERALIDAIARVHGVQAENIVLGCGSSEILRICVEAFTSPTKALISAAPTFEAPGDFARMLGRPVIAVPVDAKLRLDLDQMAAKASGAGLIFFCNPNNPTATVHGASSVNAFVSAVRRTSPGTTILIDEAYHEYVDDPTYKTAIPMAINDPMVVVSRTFSKVFGMAGMRAGYAIAHRDTARRMEAWRIGSGINVLALAAATASITDTAHIAEEQQKNREAKAFTRAFFEHAGYTASASETNFVMVDLRRDPAPIRMAARQAGVAVGRPFPPLTNWLRLSIGTMDEMKQATQVLTRVLA